MKAPTSIHGLPVLTDLRSLQFAEQVADLFGMSHKKLFFLLYKRRPRYRKFQISKKAGGTRTVFAPSTSLRRLQRTLLARMSELYTPRAGVFGFAPKRSIVGNARRHKNANLVLNIDLQDFFPSINFGRVQGIFRAKPFTLPRNVASVLAQLCCYHRFLPQGAPTSPAISNLVCRGLDAQLFHLASRFSCTYSRYADDITFSTKAGSFPTEIVAEPHAHPPELGAALRDIIERNDFVINQRKVRLRRRHQRQVVTGLVVNQTVSVPREYIREVRSSLHCWATRGEDVASEKFEAAYVKRHGRKPRASYRQHLQGRLAFLKMVRGNSDKHYLRYSLEFAGLTGGTCLLQGPSVAFDPLIIRQALWVVEGLDSEGLERWHATAFSLDGFGIMTAAHTFENAASSWWLRSGWDAAQKYKIRELSLARHYDLACISPPVPPPGSLILSSAQPTNGMDVIVAGYPHWQRVSDQPSLARSSVKQLKTAFDTQYILLESTVFAGNSGGPLLTTEGHVAGMVTYGADNASVPNSAVAFEHFGRVLSGAKVQLL